MICGPTVSQSGEKLRNANDRTGPYLLNQNI